VRSGKEWATQLAALAQLLGAKTEDLPKLLGRVEADTGFSVPSTCRSHVEEIAGVSASRGNRVGLQLKQAATL